MPHLHAKSSSDNTENMELNISVHTFVSLLCTFLKYFNDYIAGTC